MSWTTCSIGSCQRHRECMYTPCRNKSKSMRPITEPGPISIMNNNDDHYRDMAERILKSIHPEIDLVRVFRFHGNRVTELIRYNSEQVIQRRFYHAQLEIALQALQEIQAMEGRARLSLRAEEALNKITSIKPEDFGRP